MSFRNIFFIVTLVLCTSSQVLGMEPEYSIQACQVSGGGPVCFMVKTEKFNILFRQVLLSDLAKEEGVDDEHYAATKDQNKAYDCATLAEALGDFDANVSAKGTFSAYLSKAYHTYSPQGYLDAYLNGYAAILEKMPKDKKSLYFWFIENLDNDHEFLGRVIVQTCIAPVPAEYADAHLLEITLMLAKNYRRQGIASQLALPFIGHLMTMKPFENGIFCFDTRTDNNATHTIAKRIGAQLIASREVPIDPRISWLTISKDLFIIPRQ